MKVLLISTIDRGGAGKACVRLHEALLNMKVDSSLLLLYKTDKSIASSYEYTVVENPRTFYSRIVRKLVRVLKEFGFFSKSNLDKSKLAFIDGRDSRLEKFSYPDTSIDITQHELFQQADIINIHWVSEFVDYASLFRNSNKPIIWTLHDMNPFTGGEHYTETLVGINSQGIPIKRIISEQEKIEFEKVIQLKINALSTFSNLHIVALCHWMQREVKESQPFGRFPVSIIPNGIDSQIFKPRDKNYSRDLLGIDADAKVLLFVAQQIDKARKGYEFLLQAIQLLQTDVLLCSVGEAPNIQRKDIQCLELGTIVDERLMSLIYSVADVYVIPSLMDNLPNTVVESLLCGTPVIGFPVGGITDMVISGFNGLLTNEIDARQLAGQIDKFFDNSTAFNSQKIREDAVRKYDMKVQALNYKSLFEIKVLS